VKALSDETLPMSTAELARRLAGPVEDAAREGHPRSSNETDRERDVSQDAGEGDAQPRSKAPLQAADVARGSGQSARRKHSKEVGALTNAALPMSTAALTARLAGRAEDAPPEADVPSTVRSPRHSPGSNRTAGEG
jgi:hypothetical protein